MKYRLYVLMAIAVVFNGYSQNTIIESTVYEWNKMNIKADNSKEIKTIFEGSSDGFEYLNMFVTNIDRGASFELPGKHGKHNVESLVIIKTGNVEQRVDSKYKKMGPGSIALLMPGERLLINNRGDEPASLYVIMWRVPNFPDNDFFESSDSVSSHLINWNDLKYDKTAKGGYRQVIRKPTVMLEEFEMHVTTLKEGVRSHPPHTHLDEEIILVRFGQVEEFIDGKLHEVGEGSLIFLRSMVPHGIRNIGKGPCEYYAFRWIPKN